MMKGGSESSPPATHVSGARFHIRHTVSVKAQVSIPETTARHSQQHTLLFFFMSLVKEELPDNFVLPDEKRNVLEISDETDKVKEAISAGDWDALRLLSLQPGGFGGARVEAWWANETVL